VKKYKAIIFDWDGTAVESRSAPVDNILPILIELLNKGIILNIISGTTYENIAGGTLHNRIPCSALKNLYLGLGRGAYDYGFNEEGELIVLRDLIPDKETLLKIHQLAFDFHQLLIKEYNYQTDIVFSRPNYCKIDLLVNHDRGGKFYLKEGELEQLNNHLKSHGYLFGVKGLVEKALSMGRKIGIDVQVTTDAKYLEVGLSTKGDNVNYFIDNILCNHGIKIYESCFWGDEFSYLGEGIEGSDGLMINKNSYGADFFDVSGRTINLPRNVKSMGDGVGIFIKFLKNQINLGAN